jgi:DNA repair protein RadC
MACAIPIYELRLHATRRRLALAEDKAADQFAAARILHAMIGQKDREYFACLFLSTAHDIIGAHVEHVGGQATIGTIDVRCVFRAALVGRASAVVFGHNHPSGRSEPSEDDVRTTKRLVEAGQLLGVSVLDHLIVTPSPACWTSMRDVGVGGL